MIINEQGTKLLSLEGTASVYDDVSTMLFNGGAEVCTAESDPRVTGAAIVGPIVGGI